MAGRGRAVQRSASIYTGGQRRFDPDCGRFKNAAKGEIPGLALGGTGFFYWADAARRTRP
jgi:hypothetical protein